MDATRLTLTSPYTAQQMYDMVADVAAYSEFVPYCTEVRVQNIAEQGDGTQIMQVDLMIAYKIVRERYASNVLLDSKNLKINVTQETGPFRKLDNRWHFEPTETGCEVHFLLDFDFRNPLLRKLIRPFLGQAVEKFVKTFEERAHVLYGKTD